jgi:signal transduction histidine kinase/DNA-binding response OmpR family regulator
MDRETGVITPILSDSTRSSAQMGPVVALHEDDEENLWLGTRWSGLFRLDRASAALTHYAYTLGDSTSLGRANVTTLYSSPSEPDVLWIGTEGSGLLRFDRASETFSRYYPIPGNTSTLGGGYVTSLYEDARGRLWIGTRRGGLNRFDRRSETFVRFTAYNSGLPDNNISCILGDDSRHLWMGTGQGLTRFDPETELFYTYGPRHGVRAAPFVTTACGGQADTLVFGGTNGFVAFRPDAVRTAVSAPPVVLTDLHLAGQPVGPSSEGSLHAPLHETQAIQLSHDEHTFSFGFAALNYRDPEANQYSYLLEGYDDTWREVGTQRRARYHRVPPGEYVFRVRAANSDGVWNTDGASVRVTVLPPWWRTAWAYLLYGLLLAGGVFAVDRIQRRRVIERERKRAAIREAEIRAETAEVQARVAEDHAQKLEELDEAKSRFFANVSHEFRTPLTLLLGPIQDALAGRTDGLARPQLAAMHRNARRLLELINQLLDLARVETGSMQLHRQPVDLVALLRGITIAFAAQADRERIALSFHSETDRVPAFIDPDKIEKVLFNLLSNAFKFTPSGQKVRIHLQTVEGPSGEQAEIVVKDTGQGIPPDQLAHIFDRFFQGGDASTREQTGTGIGLALAKEFVELHGGQIEAESDPGFGTTFTVRVPLDQNRLAPEDISHPSDEKSVEIAFRTEDSTDPIVDPDEDENESDPGRDTETSTAACVLIVEDNADVRSYVRRLLTPRYRVVEAQDGNEGLEAVKLHHPDLVIADVMMPRRSGFDLCRDLKADEALSHLPVVLLTAKADRESRHEGLEVGADAYLAKPFDAEELLLRVENLIELRSQLRARYSDTVVVQPTEVEVSSRDAAFLEHIHEVVEEHLDDPSFGVERLAQEVNLSTRQLQRRLRTTTDLSAAAFIRKMRLERAAQLLEQDAGLVSQIAYRVGYQNADAFSRVFRQVFGVPPSEYTD